MGPGLVAEEDAVKGEPFRAVKTPLFGSTLYPEIVLSAKFEAYKKLAAGDAGFTPKRNTFEAPPPGAGLETVI